MSELTVEQVRTKKYELEDKIRRLLQEFSYETGITDIKLTGEYDPPKYVQYGCLTIADSTLEYDVEVILKL